MRHLIEHSVCKRLVFLFIQYKYLPNTQQYYYILRKNILFLYSLTSVEKCLVSKTQEIREQELGKLSAVELRLKSRKLYELFMA